MTPEEHAKLKEKVAKGADLMRIINTVKDDLRNIYWSDKITITLVRNPCSMQIVVEGRNNDLVESRGIVTTLAAGTLYNQLVSELEEYQRELEHDLEVL